MKYFKIKNLVDDSISIIPEESYNALLSAKKKIEKTTQKRVGKKMVKETILIEVPKYEFEIIDEVNERGLTKTEEKEQAKIIKAQDKEYLKTE